MSEKKQQKKHYRDECIEWFSKCRPLTRITVIKLNVAERSSKAPMPFCSILVECFGAKSLRIVLNSLKIMFGIFLQAIALFRGVALKNHFTKMVFTKEKLAPHTQRQTNVGSSHRSRRTRQKKLPATI